MNFSKISKSDRIFFGVLSLISVISVALVYALHFNGPPIRSDGIGYYSYLPSIFIHKDISMKTEMEERANKYNAEVPDSWNGIIKQEDGKFLDKYTMGEAVLMLPFFIPANVLSILFNQVPNGFTLFYQAFLGIAGTFYMILGLFILKKILEKYFKPRTIYITLIVLIFGTNLFHYGTYDSIFSHSYSLFLFAAFLYFLPIWFKNISKLKYSILLGALVGLIALTRPTNIIFPVIFILLWELDFRKVGERLKLFWKNKFNILAAVGVSILFFVPQMLYWKQITGTFLYFSYQGEYFDFTHPEIMNVLFSVQKGLLFWSPLIVLALVGIFLLRDKLKSWLLPVCVYLIINLYIISSWWAWSYGGGFGHRAFVESFAVLSLPLAATIDVILNLKRKLLKYSILTAIALLVFLSIYLMVNYWNGHLKPDGTTMEKFLNLFPAK
ncbi:MAG: hypothetical protein ACMG57_01745 [Candidatus Dojkabacteria bacterium]